MYSFEVSFWFRAEKLKREEERERVEGVEIEDVRHLL